MSFAKLIWAGVTEAQWDRARDMKGKLEDGKRSVFKRLSLAKDYERVARHLFIVVEVSVSCEHRTQPDVL